MSLLIAFSGQGSQHDKMFRLLSSDPFGRDWLKQASTLCQLDLFDEAEVAKACTDVIKVQCLLVILSVGAFRALAKQMNLVPAFLCGYSLGEISAFAVSANLALPELYSLVKTRAIYMQEAAENFAAHQETGLAVLKGRINAELVQELSKSHNCYLAIVNAEDHYILGGLLNDLQALVAEAKFRGVSRAELLAVKLASHTPILAKASEKFAVYLQNYQQSHLQYPLLNALTQELIVDSQAMLTILAQELSQTLHWDRLMLVAREYGISTFLELGPRAALKNMMLTNSPSVRAYNLEEFSTIKGLATFMENSTSENHP